MITKIVTTNIAISFFRRSEMHLHEHLRELLTWSWLDSTTFVGNNWINQLLKLVFFFHKNVFTNENKYLKKTYRHQVCQKIIDVHHS